VIFLRPLRVLAPLKVLATSNVLAALAAIDARDLADYQLK
jgi:hypothetical protein